MAGSSGLPLAGVEAIVEGLSSFQGDVRSMNSALDSISPRATVLQNVFSGAWEMVKGFGREILNVAEHALGHLLADAVQFTIQKVGELVQAVFEAGSEFQTLELRLDRLNFNALIESGMDYNQAQTESLRLTKEQLEWLQKLAAQTPYDNQDISRTFTLARSYGFAATEAQALTEDIANFASGMGLSRVEMDRIIINFGQMIQQGKLTGAEIKDLGRGAFVPVNDILEKVKQKMGVTTEEFEKMKKAGKLTGAAVHFFIESFQELVDERFQGAAEKMAQTFKGASENALDLAKSIGGLHIVKPILDVLGKRLSEFVSAFTNVPERWDRLVNAAKRIGTAISDVLAQVLGLLPSSESVADSVVSAIEGMAIWIETHSDEIVQFFKDVASVIRDDIIPWIRDHLLPIFVKISDWVAANGPTIKLFFESLVQIAGDVFKDLMEWLGVEVGEGNILDMITKFMEFVIANKEKIAEWVELLIKAFLIWQALATIWNIVIGIIIKVIGFVLSLVAGWGILNLIIGLLAPIIVPLLLLLGGLIGTIIILVNVVKGLIQWFQILAAGWTAAVAQIKIGLDQLKANFFTTVENVKAAFRNGDWIGIGRAIIEGMANGVRISVGTLINAARDAAMDAYYAALSALGIRSPSKLFEQIGRFTMEGFAQGIQKAAGLAVGAMQGAVGATIMPALSSMAAAGAGGSTITNNRAANLTINTSAPMEPILQDFSMMESLMGA